MPALYTPEFIARKLPHLTKRGQTVVHKKLEQVDKYRGVLWDVKKLDTTSHIKSIDGKAVNIKKPIKELLPHISQAVLVVYKSYSNIRKLGGKLGEISELLGGARSTNPTRVLVENINSNTLRGNPAKTAFFHQTEVKGIYTENLLKMLLRAGVEPRALKEMTKSPEYVNKVVKEFLTDKHQENVGEIIGHLNQYVGSATASKDIKPTHVVYKEGELKIPLHRIMKEFLPWFPKAFVRINRQVRPDIELHSEVNDKLKDGQARGSGVKLLVGEINRDKINPKLGTNVLFHPSQVKEFYPEKLLKKLFSLGVTKQALYNMAKDIDYIDKVFKEYCEAK